LYFDLILYFVCAQFGVFVILKPIPSYCGCGR
jgi:hypothetical protein